MRRAGSHMFMAVVLALWFVGCQTLSAQETAMYRANPRQTGVYDVTGPTSQPQVAWQHQLPAPTQPLIVGENRVLCPLVRPVSDAGRLYALEISTGTQAWHIPDLSGPPSAPAIANGKAYFCAGDKLFAVAVDSGQVQDQLQMGDLFSTACVADGQTLYFGTDGGYVVSVGVNLQNLQQVHVTNREGIRGEIGNIWAAPAVDDGTLYISSTGEYVKAIDLQTSNVVWQQSIDYMYLWMVPVDSRVCVADQRVLYAHDLETLVCANRQTGATQWEFPVSEPFVSAFAVDASRAYVADPGGTVYGINLSDGSVAWQFAAPSMPGNVSVDQQQAYFGTRQGRLCALDKATGQENWHVDLPVEEGIMAAPVPVDGALFVTSRDGKVFRLN